MSPANEGVYKQFPNIIIKPYNQQDSETHCSDGLISGQDTLVMKASVIFHPKWNDWAEYLKLVIVTDTETLRPYFVDLTKSCHKQRHFSTGCFCEEHHDYVYNVTCRFQATTSLNEAHFYGEFYHYQKPKVQSIPEKFPKIYDISEMRLMVNDFEINNLNNCSFLMDTKKPTISFCCSNTPWPCETLIKSKGNTLAQSKHCVNYTSNQPPESKYTLGYIVCNNEKKSEFFICYVSNAFPLSIYLGSMIFVLILRKVFLTIFT
ncbi:hypothetical protein Bpfe_003588 [Biomphalaria pfeifferi]|uniref:Uncharacterized protein n=1 Tax=Biomphalaria pfeifferi TaxID=112525 RepID=A0AAD8C618_BIOPF|nr:hypothetical protein Bpfe_003588 [Biomphalaria pfeifferi]